ncbi:MerR family transcriptional regulator [uncultured Duncaniella sp.]|uniref:MerR family transcriptional regulator n=1 Tax=uncultured Duncaniella sp. TaxID=2768039 RepID=UPI0025E7EB8B|nr:MerR family transcriptional regulator [uncultured Duncaniella sp.]
MEQITSKRYYKISEVAEMIGVAASTLRFWETQFPILKPRRNDRGTRFYTPTDLENARMIKFLVHDKGLKIEAALEQIKISRDGVSRKAEALNRLTQVRDKIQGLITSLHKLR